MRAIACASAILLAVCLTGCTSKESGTATKDKVMGAKGIKTPVLRDEMPPPPPPDDISNHVAGTTLLKGTGASDTLNIVILGDGFTSVQLPQYQNAADRYVQNLLATAPFDTMKDAISIYRVDVVSDEAGIDVPSKCGGFDTQNDAYRQPLHPKNALKVTWCGDGETLRYPKFTNEDLIKKYALESGVLPHMTVVLLNDWMFGAAAWPEEGGSAYVSIEKNLIGDVVPVIATPVPSGAPTPPPVGSLQQPQDTPGFPGNATHETGHLGPILLLDEYGGLGAPTTDQERLEIKKSPNLTLDGQTLQWNDLVAAGTADPTPCPSGVDAGWVVGGDMFDSGVYHARCECRMNSNTKRPFCIVCREAILDRLSDKLPDNYGLSIVFDSIRVNGITGMYSLEYKIEGTGPPFPIVGKWPKVGWQPLTQKKILESNEPIYRMSPSTGSLPHELKLTYTLTRKGTFTPSTIVETETQVPLKFTDNSGANIQAINGTQHRLTLALIVRR